MLTLRAKYVLPLARPPIENGAVTIAGDRLTAVGAWPEIRHHAAATVQDLGEVILLPGLVNAHCHLDYTELAGKIAPPRNFADWIKAMVAYKAPLTPEDYTRSWHQGAAMLLRTGTTTVADTEAIPDLLPDVWAGTPLRVISFREILCLQSGPAAQQAVRSAAAELAALRQPSRVGLSPHATYTTTPALLQEADQVARQHDWRLVTHVAESEAEFEMFMYRQGPLFAWLKNQRDMADCGRGSPVQHLSRCGYLSPRLTAIHVNYLVDGDAAALGQHGVSVVHCPRSHAYFKHTPFPLQELAEGGVNLALGTDSLATVTSSGSTPPQLDMFAEMRALAGAHPNLPPATIVRMATRNGAHALGLAGRVGVLAPHASADLIAVPWRRHTADLHEALLQHTGDVHASMIHGQWALAPAS